MKTIKKKLFQKLKFYDIQILMKNEKINSRRKLERVLGIKRATEIRIESINNFYLLFFYFIILPNTSYVSDQ
jgi:hypothetical protein